jgi:Tfp pilus assembly protein PilP
MLCPAVANEHLDVPEKFAASIASVFRGSYSVEVDGSALLYRAPQNRKTIRISPSQQQWREFRRAIDDINIWQWRSRYYRSITDGDHWSLHIEYSDRSHETGGYASYPEEAASPGSCSPTTTKPFTRFRAAVQSLLGDRPFGHVVGPLEFFELAELQLVATHPAPNPREQWAAFRDPSGKVHRVWRHVPGWRGRPPQQLTYLGAENASLREVMPTSVSLLELCQDAGGDWFERIRVVKKIGAP